MLHNFVITKFICEIFVNLISGCKWNFKMCQILFCTKIVAKWKILKVLQNWVGGFLCDHLPTTRMNDEIMQQNSNRLRSMYGMSPMNLNTPTTYNNTYVKMSIKISLRVLRLCFMLFITYLIFSQQKLVDPWTNISVFGLNKNFTLFWFSNVK